MQFKANAKKVRRALDQARRAVSSAPPLAAYTGVLLQVRGSHLLVSASDGETSVTSKLQVDDPVEGSALVVPAPLASLLDKLGDELLEVSLADDGDVCVSFAGHDPYRFRQLAATFPAPSLDSSGLSAVPLGGLGDALARVRHAADGVVQLRSDVEDLVLVATDRYRIAQVRLPGCAFGASGVVQLASLEHLSREAVDHIGIDPRGRLLRAKGSEVFVSARLVDGEFPDVGPIVDERCANTAVLDTDELVVALDRLHSVASRRPLELRYGAGKLDLRATNVELGSGREQVVAAGGSAEFSCHINASYLREAALAHVGEEVTLCWNGPRQPIHLRSDGGTKVRTLVMPVQA